MKKFLAFSLCMIMLFSCSFSAFAEEQQLPHDGAKGTTTVTYHIDSSYCVVIPETVDAFNGFQLTASYMNITDTEQVNVSISGENNIEMTNNEGDSFNLMLNTTNDHVAEFVKNQLTSDIVVYGQQNGGNMPAAGFYTGTVEFVVNLGVKPPQY